jgi:Lipocalin-like
MKNLGLVIKFVLMLLTVSAVHAYVFAGESSPKTSSAISGLWLRPIGGGSGGESGKEGFFLHEDGTLELVGIASMNGLGWKVTGKELVLTTNTDRYPKPARLKYAVVKLTDKTLTLKADDYLSGTFEKEDPVKSAALREWRVTMDRMYLDNATEYMKYVDNNAGGCRKREKTIGPEKKCWEKRKLTLLTMDSKPVKLAFTEPNGSGKMEWETSVYYLDGRISFYRGPFSGYIFSNGRLVLWVDEHMHPMSGVTEQDLKETGSGIEKKSKEYLSLFNMKN